MDYFIVVFISHCCHQLCLVWFCFQETAGLVCRSEIFGSSLWSFKLIKQTIDVKFSRPRYTLTPTQQSLLRRSHQELTETTQRHHRSGSLQTSGDHLRHTPNRHPSVIDLMPARASTNLPEDLSKWQQLHKQQLALQQADSQVNTGTEVKGVCVCVWGGGGGASLYMCVPR